MPPHAPVPVTATPISTELNLDDAQATVTFSLPVTSMSHLDMNQPVIMYQPHANNPAPSTREPSPGEHPSPFSDRMVGHWATIEGLPGEHLIVGEDSKGLTLCLTPPRGINHFPPERVTLTGDAPVDITPPSSAITR